MAIAANQIPTAVIGNIVVACATVGVLWSALPQPGLLAWATLMIVTGLARMMLSRGAIREGGRTAMPRQMRLVVWLTGIQGLLWGVLGSVLVPIGDIELRAFIDCVVVAMAAAAVASNVALPNAGRLFVIGALAPMGIFCLFGPHTRTSIMLAVLCLFYLGILLALLRGTSSALVSAVMARLHNEQLKSEVETVCAQLSEAVRTAEDANLSKSRFLANMSHEIRTPMNAVLGLATTLLDEDLETGHRQAVGAIRESADVLLRLINEVLDFSQIEAGRITLEAEPFSPRKLTRDTLHVVNARAAAKGVLIDMRWDETLPEGLNGDAGRIRQVLLNLTANAVKFTEQGQIVVTVRGIEADANTVTLEWQVRDSGIGIAPEALRNLFQDFTQADESISRRFGGSGLGLAISRRLVEMMGGTISASSVQNVGSVFSFRLTLPTARAPVLEEDDDRALVEALHAALRTLGRRMRVLLAEDNPINQFVARQLLKGFDIHVDIANNGVEAVAAAARLDYDLIYMDMRMPEMDGLEATREIRRRYSEGSRVPIVAFTANAFEEDILACRLAGMDGFITKPVRKGAFIGAALKALTQRSLAGAAA